MPVTRVTTVQQRQEMAYRVAQGAPYQTVAYQNQVSVRFYKIPAGRRAARSSGRRSI